MHLEYNLRSSSRRYGNVYPFRIRGPNPASRVFYAPLCCVHEPTVSPTGVQQFDRLPGKTVDC